MSHPFYQTCGAIIERVIKERKGIKTAFYDWMHKAEDNEKERFKQVYALCCSLEQERELFFPIMRDLFPEEEQNYILWVLVFEVARNRKIKGGGQLVKLVKEKQEAI